MTAGTTSEPALRVRGLEKSYGELRVLRGVDFEVAPGSIFALLGANGAGKTTVIRILSTLLKADAGTASVNGFDVATHPAKARESFSLTGQFAAVDEVLSGRENLVLVARLRRVQDPGQAAEDLLDRCQLTAAATRRVATYSGGMRRRLDVATATMPGPVRAFAEHQPVTSIVNAIRALYAQQPVGSDLWVALAWCVGILVVAYALAMATYHRKIA
jgi:ABC-2 type transport system ATP-binding protein